MSAALRVLNVGGGSKRIPIPPHFAGWRHDLLDIDPVGGAQIVCDARAMHTLPPAAYDAVYCSHNLEHYYRHDMPKVLFGFVHVLKPTGFAEVHVPDLRSVFEEVLRRGIDVDDTLYDSDAGPISVNDVIYGLGRQIEASGLDYHAHKNGFTPKSLTLALHRAGFTAIFTAPGPYEVKALAFKQAPTPEQRAALRLP